MLALATAIGATLLFYTPAQALNSGTAFTPPAEPDSPVAENFSDESASRLFTPDLPEGQPGRIYTGPEETVGKEISIAPQAPTDRAVLRSSAVNSRPHGKIYSFWKKFGLKSECSGVLISGRKRPVVLTAAHCVFLFSPGYPLIKADRVKFIPALKPGRAPFGSYNISGKNIYLKPRVVSDIKRRKMSNDWAFLRFSKAKKAQRYVGSDGVVFNPKKLRGKSVSLIGYPGQSKKNNGKVKRTCPAGIIGTDADAARPRPIISSCRGSEMPGGTSGGGWRYPFYRSQRVLSLTSYSALYVFSDNSVRRLMTGIQLSDRAYRAYRRASG